MPFTSCGGCLKNIFITEAEIIDRYVGNQLWTWGAGTNGHLGNNAVTSRSSPVQTVSGGTNWKEVSAGSNFTAAIKTDGTLWLWGEGRVGSGIPLGTNVSASRSSPVQTVSGGTNWKQVSAGTSYVASIKTDGTLWLWGCGTFGRLGNNAAASQSSPVQTVSGGTNWKQVSVGSCHSTAIKTDGTLWLWGLNNVGQLGTNNITDVSSPVQTVSGGADWKQVSAGAAHVASIKTDGTLWLWGDGSNGRLGNNSSVLRSSPVQTVSGGTNWKQVSLGLCFSAAIKTDGTLWTWGASAGGILGDNTTVERSSPVQTVSGGNNWKEISMSLGSRQAAAIKTDGTLWTWGSGGDGQLGTNAAVNQSSPVQTVSGGTFWKQVESGDAYAAAVTYTEA